MTRATLAALSISKNGNINIECLRECLLCLDLGVSWTIHQAVNNFLS